MNMPIVDVNVSLSRWPTRRIREDQLDNLVAKLKSYGVVEAWAGSLDGLLHKDIAAVNTRLVSDCQSSTQVKLRPFGTVNPLLPDWEEELRRCAEDHRMPGLRLHPNYHGYKLDDPAFAKLLELAAKQKLVVTMAVQMEDERMMHPLLRVKPVVLDPLVDLVAALPELKLVILNAGKAMLAAKLMKLVQAGQVYLDIALLDGLAVVEDVVKDFPLERILFGSHTPLLYFESAVLKMKEAALARPAFVAIQSENARKLLPR
ncbi:MAG: amidohydrolase family protein [Pirellulaceae bacterium]|nr:amidohydrolase family protein [Pirellulaceae bacterium]